MSSDRNIATVKYWQIIDYNVQIYNFFDRYSWDSKIKDILGSDFKLYNSFLTDNVSLKDILGHKTGVPDYFLPLLAALPEKLTRKDLVK